MRGTGVPGRLVAWGGEPGSPRDLSRGVVPQGKKVDGRRCGTGDRGAAVLRPDQATRGRVGRAPGQPGRRGGDRLRPPKRDTQARPTAPSQRRPQHTADMATTSPIGVRLFAARRGGLEENLPSGAAPRSTKRTRCHRPQTRPRRWYARQHRRFGRPRTTLTSVRIPLHPERAFARAFSRQGSSPSGTKRRSRFERSRRARPEGRRPNLTRSRYSDASGTVT